MHKRTKALCISPSVKKRFTPEMAAAACGAAVPPGSRMHTLFREAVAGLVLRKTS